MNTDRELICSERQVITGATVSSDSILTTGLFGLDRTGRLRCIAEVELAFTGGSATGLTVELVQADDAALTSNIEVLGTTGLIPTSNLTIGTRLIDTALPMLSKPYLGFRYLPAGGSYGVGVITAGVVMESDTPAQSRPRAHSSWA